MITSDDTKHYVQIISLGGGGTGVGASPFSSA